MPEVNVQVESSLSTGQLSSALHQIQLICNSVDKNPFHYYWFPTIYRVVK